MDRETVIARLREHEQDLRATGVLSLSLFGSVARGDSQVGSDVDIALRLDDIAAQGGFAYFERLDKLREYLSCILGCPVDVVVEPVRKEQLRRAIETEGARAF